MGSQPGIAPIRLAILETDTPVTGIKAKYGSYGGVFTDLFRRACADLNPPVSLESQLSLSSHDIVNDLDAYPDLESIDAVLITGSKHNAFDDNKWIVRLVEYTKRCLDSGRVRVIGVCFGHQIVGRALGAKLGRNARGWEISVVEHELTDEGKKVFGMEKLSIHQMHRDVVLTFPEGAVQLARTDVCANQAMYKPGRFISVQGHPEFTEEMVREILDLRKSGKIIEDDVYNDGISRVSNKQDGVAVARAFLRFLRED
ncbi:putative class I glutamine amidotransferase [Xylariaceae sp. FL0594]|nr:putative class I glutamine amidotransferase [Xylariaceae sp. FL0594]